MDAETRALLKASLRGHEGLVLRAYDDRAGRVIAPGSYFHYQTREPIGNVSIGIGRNLHGRGITEMEAEMLLAGDITDTCMELDELIPWWVTLDSARQVVVANMAFQIGARKFANTWPEFLSALKRREFGRAAIEMKHSRWYSQVPERAENLIQVMTSGKL